MKAFLHLTYFLPSIIHHFHFSRRMKQPHHTIVWTCLPAEHAEITYASHRQLKRVENVSFGHYFDTCDSMWRYVCLYSSNSHCAIKKDFMLTVHYFIDSDIMHRECVWMEKSHARRWILDYADVSCDDARFSRIVFTCHNISYEFYGDFKWFSKAHFGGCEVITVSK